MALFRLPVGRITADFFCSPHPTADLDPVPALVAAFNAAKTTIFFGVYSFTHPALAAGLIAAHQRGVDVHGVVDKGMATSGTSKVAALAAAGIPVRAWGAPFHLFHDKVAVIDSRVGALGSFNWTTQAETANYETLLITSGAAGNKLVTALTATLTQGWTAGTPLTA